MLANSQDIGSFILPKAGTVPAAVAAGTRNSAVIDRFGASGSSPAKSCVLVAQSGAATGTPTSFSLNAKLQHGALADGSDMADLADAAVTAITAASTQSTKSVSLEGAKRYIRTVEVTAFVGGTTPTLGATTAVILGGQPDLPAA